MEGTLQTLVRGDSTNSPYPCVTIPAIIPSPVLPYCEYSTPLRRHIGNIPHSCSRIFQPLCGHAGSYCPLCPLSRPLLKAGCSGPLGAQNILPRQDVGASGRMLTSCQRPTSCLKQRSVFCYGIARPVKSTSHGEALYAIRTSTLN